jgi:hypothetical protein
LQAASPGKIRGPAAVSGRIHFGVEGDRKNCDVTRWDRFTDIKDIKKEMLKRLEAHFEKWLNP